MEVAWVRHGGGWLGWVRYTAVEVEALRLPQVLVKPRKVAAVHWLKLFRWRRPSVIIMMLIIMVMMLMTYILKAIHSAESAFQSQKICGKNA